MKAKRIWAVCLIVLGAAALGPVWLLWAGAPDAVVRTLGTVMLLTLPALVYMTVRLVGKRK